MVHEGERWEESVIRKNDGDRTAATSEAYGEATLATAGRMVRLLAICNPNHMRLLANLTMLRTYDYSLCCIWLQPRLRMVAASVTCGCRCGCWPT